MRLPFYLVAALWLFVGWSCSHPSSTLHLIESRIERSPDSALHALQQISVADLQQPAFKARYHLLLVEALNRLQRPLQPDTLLQYSIRYYQQCPDGNRLSTCYLYKGRAFKYQLKYEKAMQYYLQAFNEMADTTDLKLMGRLQLDLGDIHTVQREYGLARAKYQLAARYFRNCQLPTQAFYATLNVGRVWHAAKKHTQAEMIYRSLQKQVSDSAQQGALAQEMAINFYDNQQADSAFRYFRQSMQFPAPGNNRAIRLYYLADLYQDVQQFDSARSYALQALRQQPDIRTERECYRILVNEASTRDNIPAMSQYMAHYQDCTDSIRKIDAQAKGSLLENVHESRVEVRKSKMQRSYLVAGIIVLSLSFSGLYRYRTRRARAKLQETHTQHHHEKRHIHKSALYDKTRLLKKDIDARRQSILSTRGLAFQEKEDLIRKLYEEQLHIHDPEQFFNEMDLVLNNLTVKLKALHPSLNTKDLLWCCLFLLKADNHEMLILLNYKTTNSLKVLKNRLAPKLQLANATLIEEYLLKLITEAA